MPKRIFVHLAYLDDSDTKAKIHKWQVMSAIIIEDNAFKIAEMGVADVPERLMGTEKLEKFEEFHACELYGGYGAFEGIDQCRRLDAINELLGLLRVMDIVVIYGAVDLVALKTEVYGSADPVDVCFRKCLSGIRSWADASRISRAKSQIGDNIENYTTERMTSVIVPGLLGQLIILIVDECDGKTKSILQKSFRSLRPPLISIPRPAPLVDCFHDDMYFGDSRYSIGIQLADLCSYFIARHLEGDTEIEGFYKMIEPRIYPRKDEIIEEESDEN